MTTICIILTLQEWVIMAHFVVSLCTEDTWLFSVIDVVSSFFFYRNIISRDILGENINNFVIKCVIMGRSDGVVQFCKS